MIKSDAVVFAYFVGVIFWVLGLGLGVLFLTCNQALGLSLACSVIGFLLGLFFGELIK